MEHQPHSDGKADNIEGHKVANGTDLLLPGSPDNRSRHTLRKLQEKVFGLLLALQEGLSDFCHGDSYCVGFTNMDESIHLHDISHSV